MRRNEINFWLLFFALNFLFFLPGYFVNAGTSSFFPLQGFLQGSVIPFSKFPTWRVIITFSGYWSKTGIKHTALFYITQITHNPFYSPVSLASDWQSLNEDKDSTETIAFIMCSSLILSFFYQTWVTAIILQIASTLILISFVYSFVGVLSQRAPGSAKSWRSRRV